MTPRFLADEDVNIDIIQGLRAHEPSLDILDVKTAGLRAFPDSALLEIAVQQDRILVTHDRRTMPRHFRERVEAGKPNPGVFILPQHPGVVGAVIDSLLLVWTASHAEEWRNRIVYLPFR